MPPSFFKCSSFFLTCALGMSEAGFEPTYLDSGCRPNLSAVTTVPDVTILEI